jgi:hypothetical protein
MDKGEKKSGRKCFDPKLIKARKCKKETKRQKKNNETSFSKYCNKNSKKLKEKNYKYK